MEFKLKQCAYYDKHHPGFEKPTRMGHFSLDGERKFHDDDHQMKYMIVPPNLNMDLNIGYTKAIKKSFDQREKISHLLKWILHHQEQIQTEFFDSKSKRTKIDFVCARGLLTTISATLYEKSEGWVLCASKFQSTIYLTVFNTDEKIQKMKVDLEKYQRIQAWGAKFEQYMTADSRDSEPDASTPVNEREEFHIVFKRQAKNYTLLCNAEVDAKDPKCHDNDASSTDCFIELKTSKNNVNKQNNTLIRYKFLKWWLQSYIAGIPKIICGLRNYDGIIEELQTFYVEDMPRIARQFWSSSSCLNFCSDFLDFVKRSVEENNPKIVYKFSWKPGWSTVKCEKLTSPGEHEVLPEWFTRQLKIK